MGYCQLHGNHLKTHSIALYLQVLRGSLLKRGNKISAGRSLFPVISLNMAEIWDVRVTLCVSLWTSKYTHYMIIKAIHPPPKALANTFNVQPPILLLTHITFYCNFCKIFNLLYFGGISIRASVTFSHTWTKNETFSGINNLEAGKSPFISLTFSVRPAAIRVSFAFRAQHKAPLSVTNWMEMGFSTGNGEMNSRVRGMGSLHHTLNIRAEQDNGRATSD